MKIRYKKSRLYTNLIFGLITSAIALFYLLTTENIRWFDFVFMVLGLIYIGMAIYESYYQHLAITDEYLEQHILFESKKMRLTDIKTVKHFAGDYIIKTDTNQININSKLLSKDSLEQLIHRLKTLEVEWI